MNISFVIGSLGSGGAERVVATLGNELCKKHKVSIFTMSRSDVFYKLDDSISLVHVGKKNSIKGISFLKNILALRREINYQKTDVLISFTFGISLYAIIASLFKKFKLIVSERNDPNNEVKNLFMKKIRKLLYVKVDGFVFQTEQAQSLFSEKIKKRSCIIYNPINPMISPNESLKNDSIIYTVGRFHEQKNIPFLIESFNEIIKKYPKYKLLIFGDGILKPKIENIIKKFDLEEHIFLLGNDPLWYKKIAKNSIFVMASLYEGMPNSLIESMALEMICISSNCPIGGPQELIKNYFNGILYPVNDKESLIDAITYCIDNPLKSIEMAKNAFNDSKKHDILLIAKQWMNFIEKLIDGKSLYE